MGLGYTQTRHCELSATYARDARKQFIEAVRSTTASTKRTAGYSVKQFQCQRALEAFGTGQYLGGQAVAHATACGAPTYHTASKYEDMEGQAQKRIMRFCFR